MPTVGLKLPYSIYGHFGAVVASDIKDQLYFLIYAGFLKCQCDSNDRPNTNIYALSLQTLSWISVKLSNNSLGFVPTSIDCQTQSNGGDLFALDATNQASSLWRLKLSSLSTNGDDDDLELAATKLEISSGMIPGGGWGHSMTFANSTHIIISGGFGWTNANASNFEPKTNVWIGNVKLINETITWNSFNQTTSSKPFVSVYQVVSVINGRYLISIGGLEPKQIFGSSSKISVSGEVKPLTKRFPINTNFFINAGDYSFQPINSIRIFDVFNGFTYNIVANTSLSYINAIFALKGSRIALTGGYSQRQNEAYLIKLVTFQNATTTVKNSDDSFRPLVLAVIIVSGVMIILFIIVVIHATSHQRRKLHTKIDSIDNLSTRVSADPDPESALHAQRVKNNNFEDAGKTLVALNDDAPAVLSLPGFRQMQQGVDYVVKKKFNGSGEAIIFFGNLLTRQFIEYNKHEKLVAIKVPKKKKEMSTNFRQEIAIIWLFNTKKNFIKIIGFSESPPAMIMRYYELGSLRDLIMQKNQTSIPDSKWSPKMAISLACDCITGLKDLHEVGIIHNDVKTANVLIERDENQIYAVLSDFGIASVVDKSLLGVKGFERSRIRGASIIYASPEALNRYKNPKDPSIDKNPDTLKAGDVYSFGMILFELICRQTPWKEIGSKTEIETAIAGGLRPEWRMRKSIQKNVQKDIVWQQLKTMANNCWNFNPHERPKAKQLVQILTAMKQQN